MIGWCWKRYVCHEAVICREAVYGTVVLLTRWGAGCGEIFGRKVVDVPSIVERAHNLSDGEFLSGGEAEGTCDRR